MYFVQHIDRLERDFKRMKNEHAKVGAQDNERLKRAKEGE
jgi:hypothetical protein